MIRKITSKFLLPYFKGLGYTILQIKSTGLFSTGNFKNDNFQFRPFFPKGAPIQYIYLNIWVTKQTSLKPICVTAKIKTLFLFVRSIEYKPQLD
jgi:hypothetical protein